ncbi:MAG: hypothetical protein CMJ27_13670 [Phycisphaerae bacterium]|nr:hypothetical protein [Phycisphaerae bacterium]
MTFATRQAAHSDFNLRRGNAVIVLVVLLATVIGAGLAVALTFMDGAKETMASNSRSTGVQTDSLLQPVANWAAAAITGWSKSNDGRLPADADGNALIATLTDRPPIEQASGFTAKPVYRRVTAKNFEIVLPTSELGGTAHYTYAYTADGRLLTAVPDHVFLFENQQEQDSLKAQPGLDDASAG